MVLIQAIMLTALVSWSAYVLAGQFGRPGVHDECVRWCEFEREENR
jgi:hypothetical protein